MISTWIVFAITEHCFRIGKIRMIRDLYKCEQGLELRISALRRTPEHYEEFARAMNGT